MKSVKYKVLSIVCIFTLLCCCLACGNNTDSALITDPVLAESRYRLGDTMGDYTITDVNGTEHSFSEILRTKKAIVLNFWFINCTPCCIEFPYLNAAYNNFSEDIEVIAINCVGDTEKDVKAFAVDNNLSFPVATGDSAWVNALNIQGFPTTVVIDRYGVVTMIHTGYIDSVEPFNNVFEFFTDENYTSTLVENISDIN